MTTCASRSREKSRLASSVCCISRMSVGVRSRVARNCASGSMPAATISASSARSWLVARAPASSCSCVAITVKAERPGRTPHARARASSARSLPLVPQSRSTVCRCGAVASGGAASSAASYRRSAPERSPLRAGSIAPSWYELASPRASSPPKRRRAASRSVANGLPSSRFSSAVRILLHVCSERSSVARR